MARIVLKKARPKQRIACGDHVCVGCCGTGSIWCVDEDAHGFSILRNFRHFACRGKGVKGKEYFVDIPSINPSTTHEPIRGALWHGNLITKTSFISGEIVQLSPVENGSEELTLSVAQ